MRRRGSAKEGSKKPFHMSKYYSMENSWFSQLEYVIFNLIQEALIALIDNK